MFLNALRFMSKATKSTNLKSVSLSAPRIRVVFRDAGWCEYPVAGRGREF